MGTWQQYALALLLLAAAAAPSLARPAAGEERLVVARGVGSTGAGSSAQSSSSAPRSLTAQQSADGYSALWGRTGELFEPGFRLFDPSHAGFHGGGHALPAPGAEARLIDVTTFGARPNDNASDSAALAAAVASVVDSVDDPAAFTVISFPPGDFLITTNLTISKRIVLRGAGSGRTRLLITTTMDELYPAAWEDKRQFSPWSFRCMFIEFVGSDTLWDPAQLLANISAPTTAGSRAVRVSSTEGIEPGMEVRIVAADPGDGSLERYLYGVGVSGQDFEVNLSDHLAKLAAGHVDGVDAIDPIRFVSRVAAVFPGTGELLLERPLPYSLQLAWAPRVTRFAPSLTHVGIEGLTLQHAWHPYPGHFKELGANSVMFSRVAHCFARDLELLNFDSGLALELSHFCTLEGIRLGVTASRGPEANIDAISCHHGISIGHSADVVFLGVQADTRCEHDISWDWFTASSVVANAAGIDLNLDLHRSGSHGNLFSNISCGLCRRPFASGGRLGRGLHSAAANTFWNYRAPTPLPPAAAAAADLAARLQPAAAPATAAPLFAPPPLDFGAALNFLGCSMSLPPAAPAAKALEVLNTPAAANASSGSSGSASAAGGQGSQPSRVVGQVLQAPSALGLSGTWLIEQGAPANGGALLPVDLYSAAVQARLARQAAARAGRPAAAAHGRRRSSAARHHHGMNSSER